MANKKEEQILTTGGETYAEDPLVEETGDENLPAEDRIPVGGSVLLDKVYYTNNAKTMRIINR